MNSRLGWGVALDAPPVHPLRLGEADAVAKVVEVDVPAAEAGQFLGPHRTVRAAVGHEPPSHPHRFGEGIDLGDGGDATLSRPLLPRAEVGRLGAGAEGPGGADQAVGRARLVLTALRITDGSRSRSCSSAGRRASRQRAKKAYIAVRAESRRASPAI
jgi:hypothetical protein